MNCLSVLAALLSLNSIKALNIGFPLTWKFRSSWGKSGIEEVGDSPEFYWWSGKK